MEADGLVDDLVESRRDEVGELYLRHGTHPVYRETDRGPGDKTFRQRRIHHPERPELVHEPLRDPEDPTGPPHVLPEHHHGVVGAHLLGQPLAYRL